MEFYEKDCLNCGTCISICKEKAIGENRATFSKEDCIRCGECVTSCVNDALDIFGNEEISVSELSEVVKRDFNYYKNSKGGVTASGGEAMLQWEFVKEFFKEMKNENISTAIDTAGNVDFKYFDEVIPYTDLFLYDLKVIDDDLHRKYTGVGNKLILNNLVKILEKGIDVEIRIPVILGVNDTLDNMKKTAKLISGFSNVRVKLLPYHSMGEDKNIITGSHETELFESPDKLLLEKLSKPFNCNVIY